MISGILRCESKESAYRPRRDNSALWPEFTPWKGDCTPVMSAHMIIYLIKTLQNEIDIEIYNYI